jgi:hypothetical protein
MAKTYFPITGKEVFVDASPPHPEETQYKISIGLENWDDGTHPVLKIQMVYAGEIAGRRSPSFPLGTDDFQRVMTKVQDLISNR